MTFLQDSRVFRYMMGNDVSQYRNMIADMRHALSYMSDRSVDREADACCTFDFPSIRPGMQKMLCFTWSENESACRSRKKMERCYPNAIFVNAGKYGHCGFMLQRPADYIDWMYRLALKEGEWKGV